MSDWDLVNWENLNPDDLEDNLYVSLIRCNMCTFEWHGVYPIEIEEDELECPNCGKFNSEIVERYCPDGSIIDENKKEWE